MFGGLFSKNKKMRCPACGAKNSEKLIASNADGDDIMGSIQAQMNKMQPELARYNDNNKFKCKACSKTFSGSLSDEWERIAKRLGEDVAVREYNKL